MKRTLLFITLLSLLSASQAREQWRQSDKFYGSLAASSLAINSEGHLFATGFDGCLYRSTDNGNNWTRIKCSLINKHPFHTIVVNSQDHLFAATSRGVFLRSTDNGNNWQPIRVNPARNKTRISSITLDSQGQIFAGSVGKIFRSTREGDSWAEIAAAQTTAPIDISALAIDSEQRLVIGTSTGSVLSSTNAGRSWQQAELTSSGVRALASNSEGHLFAATLSGGLFRSIDNGRSWREINNGLTSRSVLSLMIDADGSIFAGASGGVIFRSLDKGESWTEVKTISKAYGVWAFAVNLAGDIFAATDGGVYSSVNSGDNWTQTGLTSALVRTLASNSDGHIFAGTFGAGVYRSTDDGETWTHITSGLPTGNILSLAVNSGGEIFAGTTFNGVSRSTDNGASWSQTSLSGASILSLAINDDGDVFAGTYDFFGADTISSGIYYSTDNGVSWSLSGFGGDVNTLAVDDSGHIYAGHVSGVSRSTEHPDSSWARYWWRDKGSWFSPPPDVEPFDVWGLAVKDSANVFAASWGGGVFRLSDTTWTQVNTGLTDTVSLSLSIPNPGHIYAGTFDGSIFRSFNNGDTWILTNPGMTNRPVPALITASSGYLFAGTNGDGVFRNLVPTAQWLTSMSVNAVTSQSNPLPEITNFDLAFSGHPDATDGFDEGLDVFTAPPGFDYYAYFSIPVLPLYLSTDVRLWQEPFADDLVWTLRVVNADAITSDVSWDPSALPAQGKFVLEEESLGISVNMRETDSVQFTGNATLLIRYQQVVCVTYDFPVAGGAWYMISLPVIPDDRTVASLFPDALGAFGWNFQTGSYVPASELEPERAYWLLMLETGTAEVCGVPLQSYTNNYTEQGWDMIGSVVETSPLVDDPDGSVLGMFGWDALTQSYVVVNPFVVEPQQGYWILVFGVPSSITLGGGGLASRSAAFSGSNLAPFYRRYGELPPAPPFEIDERVTEPMPKSYGLSQNYPNPFNPETVIEYRLPEPGKVSLTVHSILGQHVRTLVDEEISAGYHHVRWDGTNDAGQRLASGVYLYRIQAGDPSTGSPNKSGQAGQRFVQTRKVVLLK